MSPSVPSDGTGPFVETEFTERKLKMNASRSAGGAAGGAGGGPPIAVEPMLSIIAGTSEGTKFLTKGVDGFPLRRQVLVRRHISQFLLDASFGTPGDYKKLIRDSIAACDFALFYKRGHILLAFVTIELIDDKSLEVTLLMSFDQKKGFGTDLLKTVNDIAKAAGYTSIVVKSIPDAQPFYEKRDFKAAGMNKSFVLMSKPVTRRRRANRRKGTRRQRK
jgi:GNAT superfamily N-acetyltransferase